MSDTAPGGIPAPLLRVLGYARYASACQLVDEGRRSARQGPSPTEKAAVQDSHALGVCTCAVAGITCAVILCKTVSVLEVLKPID